tara:strand:- start:1195 stop:1644 length:450 start_codon:yes stop_codon:yes gene_type:complete
MLKKIKMNLEGILNVSGKAGLFKVVSQSKNTIIVESLTDGRRGPVHSHSQANMLEEIGIYTYDDTKPLAEIFDDIAKKENGKQTISHKSPKSELTNYFRKTLANYDEERVYISDIKKVIQWYNAMQSAGLIELPKEAKKAAKAKTTTKK